MLDCGHRLAYISGQTERVLGLGRVPEATLRVQFYLSGTGNSNVLPSGVLYTTASSPGGSIGNSCTAPVLYLVLM